MKVLDVPSSGSLAQKTASRNRFGQYLRTRAMPTQPRTAAQIAVRSTLANLSTLWRSYGDGNRAAWDSYALSHPRLDSLGQTIFWTGFQTFVSCNARAVAAGLPISAATPSDSTVAIPEFDVAVGTAAGLDIQSVSTYGAGTVVQVWSSPPVSKGVSFNGDYRLITNTDGPTAADTIADAAAFAAKWGALSAGQKFFIKTVAVAGPLVSAEFAKSIVLT